jgi:hypothetical protein
VGGVCCHAEEREVPRQASGGGAQPDREAAQRVRLMQSSAHGSAAKPCEGEELRCPSFRALAAAHSLLSVNNSGFWFQGRYGSRGCELGFCRGVGLLWAYRDAAPVCGLLSSSFCVETTTVWWSRIHGHSDGPGGHVEQPDA